MLISYSHKFIFVHNYKVAGRSIKEALKHCSSNSPSKFHIINQLTEKFRITSWLNHKISNKIDFIPNFRYHASAAELKEQLPKNIWDNYYKFAFVRNPWDWHVSLYYYMLRNKNHYQHNIIKNLTFEEFLNLRVNIIKSTKVGLHKQVDMLCDKQGNILVDYVGKIENINEDIKHIQKYIKMDIPVLPKINTTVHKNYKEYYSEYTKDLIAEIFKDDIKTFDYKFD